MLSSPNYIKFNIGASEFVFNLLQKFSTKVSNGFKNINRPCLNDGSWSRNFEEDGGSSIFFYLNLSFDNYVEENINAPHTNSRLISSLM